MTQSGTRNKGTSVKQGKQEWGKKTICKRQEDHGDMGTDINETGMQRQRMKQGKQDKQRGVGDVMEIEWT